MNLSTQNQVAFGEKLSRLMGAATLVYLASSIGGEHLGNHTYNTSDIWFPLTTLTGIITTYYIHSGVKKLQREQESQLATETPLISSK